MAVEPTRPTPEQFLNLIRRQERGRLKVYLGSSAGVGKTYAMLREGHRLKQQGVDVAIGIVETHGRAETAEQIGDLEVIPPRDDRVPRRHPPRDGPRRDPRPPARPSAWSTSWRTPTPRAAATRKRYQDVEDLLRAGIHVITTVNVQHLESLYDEVERDHRREGQGAAARQRPGRGRPDRQRRRLGRGPAGAAEGRQGLPARARRAGPGELLHAGQPDPAPRDHADRDGPPDRPPEPPGRGRPGPGLGDRAGDGRPLEPQPERPGPAPQGGPAGRPAQRPLVRRLHPDPGRGPDPDRRRHPAHPSARTWSWPSSSAASR